MDGAEDEENMATLYQVPAVCPLTAITSLGSWSPDFCHGRKYYVGRKFVPEMPNPFVTTVISSDFLS